MTEYRVRPEPWKAGSRPAVLTLGRQWMCRAWNACGQRGTNRHRTGLRKLQTNGCALYCNAPFDSSAIFICGCCIASNSKAVAHEHQGVCHDHPGQVEQIDQTAAA